MLKMIRICISAGGLSEVIPWLWRIAQLIGKCPRHGWKIPFNTSDLPPYLLRIPTHICCPDLPYLLPFLPSGSRKEAKIGWLCSKVKVWNLTQNIWISSTLIAGDLSACTEVRSTMVIIWLELDFTLFLFETFWKRGACTSAQSHDRPQLETHH